MRNLHLQPVHCLNRVALLHEDVNTQEAIACSGTEGGKRKKHSFKRSRSNDLWLRCVRNSCSYAICLLSRIAYHMQQWQNVEDENAANERLRESLENKDGRSRAGVGELFFFFSENEIQFAALPALSQSPERVRRGPTRGRRLKDRQIPQLLLSPLEASDLKRERGGTQPSENLAPKSAEWPRCVCGCCSLEVYLMNDTLCSVAPSASPAVAPALSYSEWGFSN